MIMAAVGSVVTTMAFDFLHGHDAVCVGSIYRRDTHQLVIPVTDRWPMPYERALVLARGSLPQRLQAESGPFVFVYEGIPPEFAASMCRLLGLEMEGD